MKLRTTCVVGLLLFGGMAQAQDVAPLGEEFQINAFTTGSQKKGEVAADEQGDFVVVWYNTGGYGTDTSSSSIQAQRFASRPAMVDSFESGDLSAWSSTVQ